MSHAISQIKARAPRPAIVMAAVVACVIGLCALIISSLSTSSSPLLDGNPAAHTGGGEQVAPPVRPARVYRDPAAPGRRF